MYRQFNTYKDGIDLAFLREHCMERGELRQYRRGEAFVVAGERQHGMGFVKQGCFKYAVNNTCEGKEYITGFAFQDEFVADFPCCILHQPACVSVIALTNCKVYQIDGQETARLFDAEPRLRDMTGEIYRHLFLQVYSQYLDLYRTTPKERYIQLLRRCPHIVQDINLKDIASYLKVTPTTISKIRREISFGL